MATITTHRCDVCPRPADKLQQKVQVVFTTEQTEGRPITPHLEIVTLDLCDACLGRIVGGNPIRAHGAQGSNTYEWNR